MHETVIEMLDITKSFYGVKALDRVNFEVKKGEIHALVGENGAGKSTLMKILGGIHQKYLGEIRLRGETKNINSPHEAINQGISIIHQELMLVPDMNIAQNLFLGREFSSSGVLKWNKIYKNTSKLLKKFKLDLDPKTPIRKLGIAHQQMIEIAKAYSLNTEILVMDEPTAALTQQETDQLFELINELKGEGVSIIYISHRMEEIFKIADRATVLRDGLTVGTLNIGEVESETIIKMMVGREIDEFFEKENVATDEEAIRLNNVTTSKVKNIDLYVKKGEILGISGLVGSGRTEIARVIFGLVRCKTGEILIEGKPVKISCPQDAIKQGIGFLTEDRKRQGIIPDLSIKSNITIPILRWISRIGIIDRMKKSNISEKYRDSLRIRSVSSEMLIKNLSGGNQQKVLIARWLATEAKIMIFDEPTRGIDVGAKHEVYHLMSELAKNGLAIIMISSDLKEIIAMSDRTAVMCNGRIASDACYEETTQEEIMHLATGGM